MAFSVTWNEDHRFIEIKYSDQVDPAQVDQALAIVLPMAREHNTHFCLMDCEQVEEGPSIISLFTMAIKLPMIPEVRAARIAILVPKAKEPAQYLEFYATTASNRGITMSVFHDRSEAIAWLAKGKMES